MISNEEAEAIIAFERARETGDVLVIAKAGVEWGVVRAREARASLTSDQMVATVAMEENAGDILTRCYWGLPNAKGRQLMYIATPEEVQEYNQRNGKATS